MRYGYISFTFGSIVFASIFIAKIIDFDSKTIYYPKMKSFDDVVNAGYSLAGDPFAFARLSNMNEVCNEYNIE